MHHDTKQVTRSEIEALLPAGFNFGAFDALKIVSQYGWKIVVINGEKHVAAATEADYRASVEEMQRNGHVLQPQVICQSYGAAGCSGATCCQPWWNYKNAHWYCTCSK